MSNAKHSLVILITKKATRTDSNNSARNQSCHISPPKVANNMWKVAKKRVDQCSKSSEKWPKMRHL